MKTINLLALLSTVGIFASGLQIGGEMRLITFDVSLEKRAASKPEIDSRAGRSVLSLFIAPSASNPTALPDAPVPPELPVPFTPQAGEINETVNFSPYAITAGIQKSTVVRQFEHRSAYYLFYQIAESEAARELNPKRNTHSPYRMYSDRRLAIETVAGLPAWRRSRKFSEAQITKLTEAQFEKMVDFYKIQTKNKIRAAKRR